ncbi:MAG: hypothetical protein JMDDDDMK_05478 [Acidobacteria bacterium]|nr:hypothetical protein [Acidobacteriota bacterium]
MKNLFINRRDLLRSLLAVMISPVISLKQKAADLPAPAPEKPEFPPGDSRPSAPCMCPELHLPL